MAEEEAHGGSSAEASLPQGLERALEDAPEFRWVAAALAEDGHVAALVVQLSTHVHDSSRMSTMKLFKEAVAHHCDYVPLVIPSDADEDQARQLCNNMRILRYDSDESKQEFEKWKENPTQYIADKSRESTALPEIEVYLKPIEDELEHHLLPVLQVVPSNKVLLWAKHNGYVRGDCTQERLVNLVKKSGKFSIERDDERRYGSDVTEYEERPDGPNVKFNEFKILKYQGRDFKIPERDEGTIAEYVYGVFQRIVIESLWHVVFPGVERAIKAQEQPLRGYLEKNLDPVMHFLEKIEALGGSDTALEDQLKRFFWSVINGAQSEDHKVFYVLLHEAVAAYLLSFFPPYGNHSSLKLKCIASAFDVREEDVKAAANIARRENSLLQLNSDTLTLYLTYSA